MLSRPSHNQHLFHVEAGPQRLRVSGAGESRIGGLEAGALRLGRPGSPGIVVELDVTAVGVELVLTVPSGDFGFQPSEPLALWWSLGDARMELAAKSVEEPDGSRGLEVSWPPVRHQNRQHRRVRVELPVWLHLLDHGTVVEAVTSDLSVGGMSVVVPPVHGHRAPTVGNAVIAVPQLEAGTVGAAGHIVRVGARNTVSVAFSALGAADEAKIASEIRAIELRAVR